MSLVPGLKDRVITYCNIHDKIRAMNEQLADLRRIQREAEMNLIEIVSTKDFENNEKIRIAEDESYIRILRPNKWNKPWSLSKSLLKQMLEEYYKITSSPSADECYEFICETMKPMLVSDTFSIERVVKK